MGIGHLICKIRDEHALGISKVIIDGHLFQVTCPRCGAFALLTQTDIELGIIEALTQGGRYTNIERIALGNVIPDY